MTPLDRLEQELISLKTGWWDRLSEAIPELEALTDTLQPPEHHAEGDVKNHTQLAVKCCPSDCDADLLWIALLHDIGKPATTKQGEDGRITAHGHDKLGSELADKILLRLNMPEARRERIVWVIRHHMFHHSWQLKSIDELSNRHRAYLADPKFPLLLEFLRVDSLASHGNKEDFQDYWFYKNLFASIVHDR